MPGAGDGQHAHACRLQRLARLPTVLAFLRHLDDADAQAAVLRRRLAFLEEPAGFFHEGDRPLSAEEVDDPFRRGVLTIARATSREELRSLRETITSLPE